MKNPIRITVALDESTVALLEKIKREIRLSQSEIMRRALRFYHENRDFTDISVGRKLSFYADMLLSNEHVILDVDHWLLFLDLIESSPEKECFWKKCREVAKSHAEQLRQKVRSVEDLLERLEACNFFRMTKNCENNFTLVLGSERAREFVRIFLEEFLSAAGLRADIRGNIAKLRVTART